MYSSQSTHAWLPYINCHKFVSWGIFQCLHYMCVWPTALKLGCVTNLIDMLILVIGFIILVDEIQFMLISSCHICIRSMTTGNIFCWKNHWFSIQNFIETAKWRWGEAEFTKPVNIHFCMLWLATQAQDIHWFEKRNGCAQANTFQLCFDW